MEGCLFCDFAQGRRPVDKLHDDDLVYAIRDINPRAPVHILVIPKEHIPSAREVEDGHAPLLARMFTVAHSLAQREGIAERGYRLAINVGTEGGQTIYHLHMHLLGGRRMGKEG
ncbi:MAG: histidine triad nucleotide-binding protein [Dehalococcoidia bacterium]|jgi:histidine triad (HIT) family protein|nr:histidine triad nucleotide-binding protein [Dehalococcoidia bacterium]MDW8008310.1 histidine triad nucleotide-binding protein [Chloroflexota bacterium]